MDILSKVYKQTFWQIVGKVVTSISTFVLLGIIARNYHETGTGLFTLTLTYLTIFNLLADFGFNAHILKKDYQNQWRRLLGVRVVWSAFLVIVSIGLLPILPFVNWDFALAVILGSLAIVGSGIFTTCNLIFQGKQRYDLSVLASSVGTIIGLGLYIWLATLSLPIPFFLTAYAVSWLVIALFSLVLISKFLPFLRPIFDKQYSIRLFKETWPIAATLALNVIYFRIDAFMISFYKGFTDAGIYNVSYSIFQSALMLPTFIMNAYYPLMLKSLSAIKFIVAGLIFFASFGTALSLVFAPTLINLLTGGGFEGSVVSLRILSLGFPAFFLSSFFMWLLVSRGQYRRMLLIYLIGLIFNLCLNFFYIPQYSFIAAAWITVISEFLILVLQSIVVFGYTR